MKNLRNLLIYEVYVRNHTEEGTFKAFINDLDRIKSLGVDYIWFMPIHEISQENKKGSLGCPYAIKDFMSINPEYGTKADFALLIKEIHKRDMKVMIDIVFNHTGYNSKYYQENKDFFYKNEKGNISNKVGDWYDIIDLDYSSTALQEKQIDVLRYWSNFGIDGYRCDVAPLMPMDFWIKARKEIERINPNTLWLAETVHPHFLLELRDKGFIGHSDCETYQAFDITYDYDVDLDLKKYLKGEILLEKYLEKLRMQEYIYPKNYVKMRFLENHDVPRAAKLIPHYKKLKQWTAFKYFEKGAMLLYAGQEALDTNLPSLFDKDLVNWNHMKDDFTNFLIQLKEIKSDPLLNDGVYTIHETNTDIIYVSYKNNQRHKVGIFNLSLFDQYFSLDIPDGSYKNLIDSTIVTIKNNEIHLSENPIIFDL